MTEKSLDDAEHFYQLAVRKHFAENPTHFDPRQYLAPARDLIEEVVAHKIDVVFGAAGHAFD